MGCETGNCPSCKVEVGYIDVFAHMKHLFIMYTDEQAGLEVIYRGGPETGSKYSENAAAGISTEYRAPQRNDPGDPGSYFGLLITHRQEDFNDQNPDYKHIVEDILLVEGPEYCGLDWKFTEITKKIGELGRSYDLPDVDGIGVENSNATVRTILHEMGLPERKPNITAPGWTNIMPLRPTNQTVPVGQVSSARPPGVMGSIPIGSETNALDVISERNARYR